MADSDVAEGDCEFPGVYFDGGELQWFHLGDFHGGYPIGQVRPNFFNRIYKTRGFRAGLHEIGWKVKPKQNFWTVIFSFVFIISSIQISNISDELPNSHFSVSKKFIVATKLLIANIYVKVTKAWNQKSKTTATWLQDNNQQRTITKIQ